MFCLGDEHEAFALDNTIFFEPQGEESNVFNEVFMVSTVSEKENHINDREKHEHDHPKHVNRYITLNIEEC